MNNPLVSVIVLSYNHSRFVEQALSSVFHQTYPNIEVIAIDDCSKDTSVKILQDLSKKHSFLFLRNDENLGNCKTFNRALEKATGKYVIDLAADDCLLPLRIEKGVDILENLPDNFGVHFCDALLIDEKGSFLGTHYSRNEGGELLDDVPQGWIFCDLLERYFISPPTMMIKRAVLNDLKGYDENLTYEDFDFWVRSSRKFRYAFTDEILVKKRIVAHSHSHSQKKFLNRHISSTRKVCAKAFELCESREEFQALTKRINYEQKWAVATGNLSEALKLQWLKRKITYR